LLPFILSCINEDLSACKKPLPGIRLVAAVIPGIELIQAGDIGEVELFIFDENKRFMATEKAVINEQVYLSYPEAGKHLYVVAIANAMASSQQSLTSLKTGEPMDSAKISLHKEAVFDGRQLYAPPTDLFHGELRIDTEDRKTELYELPLRRIVSAVSLKVKGLRDYLQTDEADWSVLIGSPYNTIGFSEARPRLTRTGTDPAVYTALKGERLLGSAIAELPLTRILSSAEGENLSLRLYHGTKLIHTLASDSEGKPLKAVNGKLLEIWIDLSGSVSIAVRNSPWGKVTVWKEF
jgi:hypothetical protein